MAEVILEDVVKVYDGGVKAVDDFNLKIDDQEFIVFVGPSGCGKSTTLRMIAGLEEITSGKLYIDGVLSNNIPPRDRDIAMVFQNYSLYPHMTVKENMSFGLRLRKFPRHEIEEKIKKAARILDIEELLDRKPSALSGGQRQRVAMGRAIVRNPKVFLMDEPLSNLDAKLRVQMRLEISRLYQQLNTTFIYVTHDQTEAMTLGTRIVVMKDGLIQQVDSPEEIYDHPKNLFVAEFIGSPKINTFYGKTEREIDDVRVHFLHDNALLTDIQSDRVIREGFEETQVIVGVRPEKIVVDFEEENKDDYFIFKGIVDLTENLGSEAYVHVLCEDQNVTLKTDDTKRYRSGDEIIFGFKKEDIHLFDRVSEKTIF